MRARTAFRLLDERVPDELRNVENRLARAHLACPDAHHVVEPPVSLVIAQVRGGGDNLSSLRRIGAAVAKVVEHDEPFVIGLDEALEVKGKRAVCAEAWMVGAPNARSRPSLGPALG